MVQEERKMDQRINSLLNNKLNKKNTRGNSPPSLSLLLMCLKAMLASSPASSDITWSNGIKPQTGDGFKEDETKDP
ncbi:hypothetical protein Y032_0005g2318 [Ancylostoma ceylanicum]|uniref:Uncharacterized protein n=1 Tax=Ancylostoma ceylanicum TaxID=53326 RepID=A0A016VRC9_9BILA|nr:hypothetical protein Y032_0005g2318 [Ancylostoma ceylanicum]